MGLDYYEILGLPKSATCDQIKKAYRSLALKLHPLISSEGEAGREKFCLVCEAYEVLSNPKLKAIFDHYGEEGLKNGAPIGDEWSKKYEYHGDICKTFQNFFGGDNPFDCTNKRINKELEINFGGRNGRGQLKQDPPIEQDLFLSLEEVYRGCVKKMKISRRVDNFS